MKMRDLETRTGVNRETIRVYLRHGLVPEPIRPKPNVADYDDSHVRAVLAVRQLQRDNGLTLRQIKEVLSGESGERRVDEGCLSVPGFRGEIVRSVKVLAKGIDPYTGKEVRIKAQDDLMAEALEHEIDHVNGILYIDYLPNPGALIALNDAPEVRR